MKKFKKIALMMACVVGLLVIFANPASAQGSSDPTDTQAIVGVFTAFLFAIGPLALLTERAVTFLKTLLGDLVKNAPAVVWLVAGFAVALGICLGWQYNFIATLAHSIPAMTDKSTFDGVSGQVLTGLSVGAAAGFWHEKIAELRARRGVPSTPTPVNP